MAGWLNNLLIPRKTQKPVQQPDYGTDMRAIEQWAMQVAKQNPIIELVAGTGITLNPTDGLGPTVEISASGTGGYASLTGVGETTTPGALSQDGDFSITGAAVVDGPFTVDDTTTTGILARSDGPVTVGHGFVAGLFYGLQASGSSSVLTAAAGQSQVEVDAVQVEIVANITCTFTMDTTSGFKFVTAANMDIQLGATAFFNVHDILGSSAAKFIPNTSGGVNASEIGFYGVPPVTQQSGAPIATVADVVTALQNLGLLGP